MSRKHEKHIMLLNYIYCNLVPFSFVLGWTCIHLQVPPADNWYGGGACWTLWKWCGPSSQWWGTTLIRLWYDIHREQIDRGEESRGGKGVMDREGRLGGWRKMRTGDQLVMKKQGREWGKDIGIWETEREKEREREREREREMGWGSQHDTQRKQQKSNEGKC